jgi:hypothetical protein
MNGGKCPVGVSISRRPALRIRVNLRRERREVILKIAAIAARFIGGKDDYDDDLRGS